MKATLISISIFAVTLLAYVGPICGQVAHDILAVDKECKGNFQKVKPDQVNVMGEQLLGGKIKVDGMKEACKCQMKVKFNAQKDGVEDMVCFSPPEKVPNFQTPWKYDPKSNKMVKEELEELFD